MSGLFKARVQGGRDYIGGIKKCDHSYEAEEVAQWQIGWDYEQEIHSLSSAKKELEEKLEKAKESSVKLERCIENREEEYTALESILSAVKVFLGVILLDPPFFKKNVLKKIKELHGNIRIFENMLESEEDLGMADLDSEEIPNLPTEVKIGRQYNDDPDVVSISDLHD